MGLGNLSCNTSLPWSEILIDKYIEKWYWGSLILDGDQYTHKPGLTGNEGLPWSLELVRKYSNKWFWDELSLSNNLTWSLNLINEFYDKWNWDYFIGNMCLFDKVFGPVADENFVDEVMTMICEKNP